MNIDYLIQLLGNRLNALMLAKDQAFSSGDLERINTIDAEINSVNDTLSKLSLLNAITQVASTNSATEADIVTAGVEAVQKGIYRSDLSTVFGEYDISSYATDPLHEQKIANILQTMGAMADSSEIDLYIDSKAISSPVTAMMILNAVQEYPVDVRLLMAIMELDSRFGTAGVAVDTMNPGNVGNTGTAIRNYASWQEGVTAVAEWLSRHRILNQAVETPENIQEETVETSSENNTDDNATSTEELVETTENTETATSTEEVIVPDDNATSTEE